mmetsp:Transcript_10215/g.41368  ORF Transcript_10215/g.41368 Transcript_10215/m.41368 type:complete len:81 (+) Transcript_10215:1778-2020(+)
MAPIHMLQQVPPNAYSDKTPSFHVVGCLLTPLCTVALPSVDTLARLEGIQRVRFRALDATPDTCDLGSGAMCHLVEELLR